MRKLVLRIVGAIFIGVALLVFAKFPLRGLFNPSRGFNGFFLAMGILSFAAADLGGDNARWFDFSLGIILAVLSLTSAGAWLAGSTSVYVGTIFFTGLTAILILAAAHRLRSKQ